MPPQPAHKLRPKITHKSIHQPAHKPAQKPSLSTPCPVYEPQEDSLLLEQEVKTYARGAVLDMGTGSGIQARAAAQQSKVTSVLAVDINPAAVAQAKKSVSDPSFLQYAGKISFKVSDLFSAVPKKDYDTIIFNPPYLPAEPRAPDIALDGGRKGYEATAQFLAEASGHLAPEGKLLLLFSSLTSRKKVDECIAANLLCATLLNSMKLAFEELYVYLVGKTPLLRELEARGISGIAVLAKGHRGKVFSGAMRDKRVAIKAQREDSPAQGTVDCESEMLARLNKKRIGPKLYFAGKNFFVSELMEGETIEEFLTHSTAAQARSVLKNILEQCFAMDMLGINKEEMHHPYKHVIVAKKGAALRPVMIDFERANFTPKPHNVTQFCQYITSPKVAALSRNHVNIDRKKVSLLAQQYQKKRCRERFLKIAKEV